MNNLSVIIPSRNADNFLKCAEAVRLNEPEVRIIFIDDGMDLSWLPKPELMPCYGHRTGQPFNFSRNVNAGIRVAEHDDVIVLNDDAILKTPGGFTLLQKTAEEHPEYGVIASTANMIGNFNQMPKGIGLRPDPEMVCFVAALIPRRTIEKVGLLNEEFDGYGFEDKFYCLRVRKAGLKIGIHDGCFVDHDCLPSTYRHPRYPKEEFARAQQIYNRITAI